MLGIDVRDKRTPPLCFQEEWLEKLLLIQSNPKFSALQKATETVKILPKLKSTVMPKFIDPCLTDSHTNCGF